MPARSSQIARRALRLLVGTLGCRALGFARMLLMAFYFGGRGATDIFFVAYLIPNLFRRALGEEVVESAFLPVFRSMLTRGERPAAWRTALVVLKWFIVLLLAGSLLCFIFAPQLVTWILAPGFDAEMASEAIWLGRLMVPFMIVIGLAAFTGALLLAHDRPLSYSLCPILFNVGWIGGMVLFHRSLGTTSLAVGVLAGGVLYLAATLVGLAVAGRQGALSVEIAGPVGWRDGYARAAFRAAVPVGLAAVIARAAGAVDCAVASTLPEGAVSALRYALPLILLPFALFGLSVGRAALVPLSEYASQGDLDRFESATGQAIHLGLLVLVPLSVGTVLLAGPLAGVFQSGQFQEAEARLLTVAVAYYALSLVGMGFVSIFSRAMYALKDTWTPLKVSAVALFVNAVLSILLARTRLAHGGIAGATAIAMTLQAVLLFRVLKKVLRQNGADIGFGDAWRSAIRIAIGTVAMVGPTWAALAGFDALIASPHLVVRLLRVAVPALAGGVAYGLVMLILDRKGLQALIRA